MTRSHKPRILRYDQASYVNPQITDSVTQANVAALSISPAVSAMQSYLSLSQAQGVLFANMVNNQQQLAISGQVAVVEGIIQLFGLNKGPAGPPAGSSGDKQGEPAAQELDVH